MKRRASTIYKSVDQLDGISEPVKPCVLRAASPASRNEELSDARHSNRSDPQVDYTGFDYTLDRTERLERELAQLKEELRQSREASSSDAHPGGAVNLEH